MKQWLVLIVLALVIWWVFFRPKSDPDPGDIFPKYIHERNLISEAQEADCDKFIEGNVTFEGGPDAFKNLHKIIRHKYVECLKHCYPNKWSNPAEGMKEYVGRLNQIPTMYVDDMTSMYKKYGIPESLRNKHMDLINSHHDQIIQNENKWFKIFYPQNTK